MYYTEQLLVRDLEVKKNYNKACKHNTNVIEVLQRTVKDIKEEIPVQFCKFPRIKFAFGTAVLKGDSKSVFLTHLISGYRERNY